MVIVLGPVLFFFGLMVTHPTKTGTRKHGVIRPSDHFCDDNTWLGVRFSREAAKIVHFATNEPYP
jgi:hypothetical protein